MAKDNSGRSTIARLLAQFENTFFTFFLIQKRDFLRFYEAAFQKT